MERIRRSKHSVSSFLLTLFRPLTLLGIQICNVLARREEKKALLFKVTDPIPAALSFNSRILFITDPIDRGLFAKDAFHAAQR